MKLLITTGVTAAGFVHAAFAATYESHELYASPEHPIKVEYFNGRNAYNNRKPISSTDFIADMTVLPNEAQFATSGLDRNVGAVFTGRLRFPKSGRWEVCGDTNRISETFINGVTAGGEGDRRGKCALVFAESNSVKEVRFEFYQRNSRPFGSLNGLWKVPGGQDYEVIPASAWTLDPLSASLAGPTPQLPITVDYYDINQFSEPWVGDQERDLPSVAGEPIDSTDYVNDINFPMAYDYTRWCGSYDRCEPIPETFATSGLFSPMVAVFTGRLRFPESGRWDFCFQEPEFRYGVISELWIDGGFVMNGKRNENCGFAILEDSNSVRDVRVKFHNPYVTHPHLILEWSSASTDKEVIPPSAWTLDPLTGAKAITDDTILQATPTPEFPIKAQYYSGDWDKLPNFDEEPINSTTYVSTIQYGTFTRIFANSGLIDRVAAVFTGRLRFPESGAWKLCISGFGYEYSSFKGNDGSQVLIDGKILISDNAFEGTVKRTVEYFGRAKTRIYERFMKCGIISMESAGVRDVEVMIFGKLRAPELRLEWTPPGSVRPNTVEDSAWTLDPLSGSSPSTSQFPITVNYYSGLKGSKVPNFRQLIPVSSDVVANIDFGQNVFATSGLAGRVGADFTSRLRFPESGTWTLCTSSNDGSQLFVDEALIVDNDGDHGQQERCGKFFTQRNSVRDVRVTVIGTSGDAELAKLIVSWKAPGQDQRVIPRSAWTIDPLTSPTPQNPITVKYYQQDFVNMDSVRDSTMLASMPIASSDSIANIDFPGGDTFATSNLNRIAAVFTGRLRFPERGLYELCINTDHFSELYVDGKLANYLYPAIRYQYEKLVLAESKRCVYVMMESIGVRDIRISTFALGNRLIVEWKPPGKDQVVIPPSAWTLDPLSGSFAQILSDA